MDFGIRVGVALMRGGSILLVRHGKPGLEPYWVLPGGRLEPGETIPECARREVREETNLEAEFSGVLYVSEFMSDGRHTVDITVKAEVADGQEAFLGGDPEAAPGEEPTLKDIAWIEVGGLREIELKPRRLRDRISDGFADGIYLGDDRG